MKTLISPVNKLPGLGMVMIFLWGIITSDILNAQQVSYNGSVYFSSGKYYFTEISRSMYINNGVSFNYPKFHISTDLSYVMQNTPWISYTSTGGIATGGPQHGAVSQHDGKGPKGRRRIVDIPDTASYSQSGFSDPTVSFRYDLFTSYNEHTMLSVTGATKIPFADPEMGFGTGEWDFSFGSSLISRTQNWYWNASAAYWFFGDMPDLELKDALSYGAGIGRSLFERKIMVLYSLYGMTKVIDETDAPISTGLGISYKVGPNATISSNVAVGLSESTPDYSLGLGWMIDLK